MNSIIFDKWFELKEKNFNLRENEIFFEKIYAPSKIDVYLSIDFYKKIEIYFSFCENDLVGIKFDNYFGLDLTINKMTNLSEDKIFLIISKNKGFNDEIYLALISTLYDSLRIQTDSFSFIHEMKLTLRKFKNFFEKSKLKLKQSQEIGLYGELLYLDNLIDKKDESAINYWLGPNRNRHDFELNDIGYEVKSTLKQKNVSITISSEVQLDQDNLKELNLILYTLERNTNGMTLIELARKLFNKFSSVKNKILFKANLLKLGFDIDNNLNDQSYKVIKFNTFKIDGDFPKIIKSNLDKNIFDVKYKINIDHLL